MFSLHHTLQNPLSIAMSLEEYIQKLECQKDELNDYVPFGIAVQSIHSMAVERIFVRGENQNNQKIGQYSEKPLYVSMVDKTKSPKKLQPQGKTGKKVFKSGKPHTSRYFTSYKDFKNQIGRRSDFVNLTLFGNLKSNFANGGRGENETPFAIKVSEKEYIVGLDRENTAKAEGLTDHFGGQDIFHNSSFELSELKRIQEQELLNTLSKC